MNALNMFIAAREVLLPGFMIYLPEIIFFLYKLGQSTYGPTTKYFLYSQICHQKFELERNKKNVCDVGDEIIEDQLQLAAGEYIMVMKILQDVPAFMLGMFCGGWSDSVGRKIPMMLPCIGGAAVSFAFAFFSWYRPHHLIVWILFGIMMNSVLGRNSLITMAIHSYVADVSLDAERTRRLGSIMAWNFFGLCAGALTMAILADLVSVGSIFMVVGFILTLAFCLIKFLLPESVATSSDAEGDDVDAEVEVYNEGDYWEDEQGHKHKMRDGYEVYDDDDEYTNPDGGLKNGAVTNTPQRQRLDADDDDYYGGGHYGNAEIGGATPRHTGVAPTFVPEDDSLFGRVQRTFNAMTGLAQSHKRSPRGIWLRKRLNGCFGWLRWHYLKETLLVVLRWRPNGARNHLVACYAIIILHNMCKSGEIDVLMLFVRHKPLSWEKSTYGYLLAFQYATVGSFLCFLLPVLSGRLNLSDTTILGSCLLLKSVGLTILGFASESWMVFVANMMISTFGMIISTTKSLISKLVDPDETGKCFSLLASSETVSDLFGVVLFTRLYRYGIRYTEKTGETDKSGTMRSLPFFSMAVLHVGLFAVAMYVKASGAETIVSRIADEHDTKRAHKLVRTDTVQTQNSQRGGGGGSAMDVRQRLVTTPTASRPDVKLYNATDELAPVMHDDDSHTMQSTALQSSTVSSPGDLDTAAAFHYARFK